ncbi:Gag protease polyprotein [Gossypium australe]|uniref:Gag protease polyprotein n=1 Tax=Gossypium australe TaxID=47621 RepID=A0A5B6WFR3_9ROSI|nr:Gag protease polyprotein [Gossypium australe]
MLRSCVIDFRGTWKDYLPLAEFAYNNSYQSSIQMAPYKALYGRRCRTPSCWTELGERCPLEIQGVLFLANLMELPFKEFDLILGMERLVQHRVNLDCATKKVTLRSEDDMEIIMVEFGIKIFPSIASVSIAPYDMAPKELRN